MWLGLRRRLARGTRPAETVAAAGSPTTWPVSYFDDLYAESPDPWGFETKWYERRKYQITLAALPLDRYRRAYEPGCSIGVLTEMLASRCDFLIASDFAPAAVAAARRRVGHLPRVEVRSLVSPREWPEGMFDLIVVSELAAYFDDADLMLLVRQVARSLDAGGHLVLVHFRPQGETPQSAEGIHAAFKASAAFVSVASHMEPEFLLDTYARTGLPGP
jgi:SAM-dependent methyltransferase